MIFVCRAVFLFLCCLGLVVSKFFLRDLCCINFLFELIDWEIEAKEVFTDLGLSNNYLIKVGHDSFNTW